MSTDIEQSFERLLGTSTLVSAMRESLSVILVDLETSKIKGITPNCLDLFGYNEQELIGEHLEMLLPKEFRKRHKEYVKEYRNNPRTIRMGDRKIPSVRKDGSGFTANIWLIPTINNDVLVVVFNS